MPLYKKLVKSLSGDRVFHEINKVGHKISTSCCLLIIAPTTGLVPLITNVNVCHLGMKVTKRLGCAVVRNKIKRKIRYIVLDLAKEININSVTIVVIARRQCVEEPFQKLYDSIRKGIKKFLHLQSNTRTN